MHSLARSVLAASTFALVASPAFSESRTFDLDQFDKIQATSGVDVNVMPGDRQEVRIEARNGGDFKHLEMTVRDGTLRLATHYGFLDFIFDGGLVGSVFRDGPVIEVFVTMPTLTGISASSGADANVTGFSGANLVGNASSGGDLSLKDVAYESISLSASSGADIDAEGTCVSLEGQVSSGADIDAAKLECKSAEVRASSGGDLDVFASNAVDVRVSSGGDVSVTGNPAERDIDASSGGDVHFRR